MDNTAHLEQLQEVNATYATTLSIKREKYNEAERRLAELQSGEDAYILKAIENQKGRKMADLYKSGNSWAAAETKAIRSRASLDYQKKIKAAEKEVSNSYADLNTFIANRDIQGGRTIDNLAATIETRESQNLQTVQRRAGTFWWIDLSLLPLSVLLSLFYAAWKKAAGVVETASQSVHYGLFEIIGLSIGRQVSRLVEWFAKFAGITDSFSSVGRQQTDSSRQQTTPPTDIIPIADSSVMDGLKEEYLFKSVQTLSGRVDNLEEIVATDNRQQFELSADNKTDSGRQLSDNADSFRQQTTDNRQVEVVHDVQDLSKLVDRTKKQYARQFTSETDSARERNKEKAEAGIKQLRELGCVVAFDREDETKLHITTPTVGE